MEIKRRNLSNGNEEPVTPPSEDLLDAQTEEVKPTVDSPSCREHQQSTSYYEHLETPKLTKKRCEYKNVLLFFVLVLTCSFEHNAV